MTTRGTASGPARRGLRRAAAAGSGAAAAARASARPLRPLARWRARRARGRSRRESAEVRDLVMSVGQLAGEAGRLRAEEEERSRLQSMARATGLRIRQHLRVADLVGEAREAIEEHLDGDVVYLHVKRDGKLGPPEGHEHDWVLPPDFYDRLPRQAWDGLHDLYRRQASMVVQDVRDPAAVPPLEPEVQRLLVHAGVVSLVLTPFGTGSELLGLIVAHRMRPGRPWKPAEVAAMEWIAADLGGGLHHARMYEAENRLVEELRALDSAKSGFLATVSHELRTPLTSIAGYVEILRDSGPAPGSAEYLAMLDTVDRNTSRLRHLIEDVLTLSKIESGAFKTAMQPVGLGEIITGALAALHPQAVASGVTMSAGTLPDRLLVSGDPGQLDRMLMNLASNAVKFTPAGGAVRITGRNEGRSAVVDVTDTGIGIPESERRQLFSRFFRASNAVGRSIPGSGLGLAIVRTIVANHGGKLEVISREGEGTTVTVRIPRLNGQPGPADPAAASGRPPSAAPAAGG